MEINRKSVLLSAAGGSLDFVAGDGEVLGSVPVPAGRTCAAEYIDLVPEGASIEVGAGVTVLQPRSSVGIQSYGAGSHDSAANPDFQPTSASRMEREMRLTMARMQAATARVEARERALAQVERMSKAPAEADPEVIETPAAPAQPGE